MLYTHLEVTGKMPLRLRWGRPLWFSWLEVADTELPYVLSETEAEVSVLLSWYRRLAWILRTGRPLRKGCEALFCCYVSDGIGVLLYR